MFVIYLLIFCYTNALPQYHYNMYNTDQNQQDQDGYCLYYYANYLSSSHYIHKFDIPILDIDGRVKDDPFLLIPYCIRMSNQNFHIEQYSNNKIFHPNLTFSQLQKNNITTEMLLSWSASIDLVERYDMFLRNISDPLILSEIETTFYNCTSEWFGPFCLFGFFRGPLNDASIPKLVKNVMLSTPIEKNIPIITCYKHLNCKTIMPFCLDWREICNGKIDCLDESDELNCWQMEINECSSNEYRCHNGQCIPKEFYHDDPLNPDCLDQTDEVSLDYYPSNCGSDSTFRCLEQKCRPGNEDFPCGDGQCVNNLLKCFNNRDNIQLSDSCLKMMNCLTNSSLIKQISCTSYLNDISRIEKLCPSFFQYPIRPILFEHIRFIYTNKINTKNLINNIPLPIYICYDKKLCENIFPIKIYFQNLTCTYFNQLKLNNNTIFSNLDILIENIKIKFHKCLPIIKKQKDYCINSTTMYQCYNSNKCISKYSLHDSIYDCPFNDDEINNDISLFHHKNSYYYKCLVNNKEKYFSSIIIRNNKYDCDSGEDEYYDNILSIYPINFKFSFICDGYIDMKPILINGTIHTDETDCQYWPCNNTYTQCNGFWSCLNGADEINCLKSNCPLFYHKCIFLNETFKISCISINYSGNGIIDCLGETDELYKKQLFNLDNQYSRFDNYFQCLNNTKRIKFNDFCNKIPDCPLFDDEPLCTNSNDSNFDLCNNEYPCNEIDMKLFRTEFSQPIERSLFNIFILKNMPNYSIQIINDIEINQTNITSIQTYSSLSTTTKILINNINTTKWWCHLGIPIYIRNNQTTFDMYCLCPPSVYGNHCEYQNERISLTIQIQFSSNWNDIFIFLIILIDNEKNIQSYDYFDYSSIIDCDTKFNIYLLYLNRLKNFSKTYFIQIDLLNKISLNYHSSWIYPIKYLFLPVYRLSILLKIPVFNSIENNQCILSCIHGQCFNYINYPNQTFCRCYSGWSGIQCNIKLNCSCSLNSLCLSNSICICPLNQYGPRCYLNYSLCHSNPCLNSGQCISSDLRLKNSYLPMFRCICSNGYYGDRCENKEEQNQIEISFHQQIDIPLTLLIHFINIEKLSTISQISLIKKIPIDQNILIFSTSIIFNIAFVQILNNYYLIILREKNFILTNIKTKIDPLYQCLSINKLLNITIMNEYILKRIKYYHLLCQNNYKLICFYDEYQICLCNINHHVNCFNFNHNINYNCRDNNYCLNHGQCLLNKRLCPTSSICICQKCYYGSKCQFSKESSTLSLDIIIGQHIRQNTTINQQTIIIKYSIVFNIIILIFGLINFLLIILTFRLKETRNVGCNIYLFISSIISLIIIILLQIKFWLLILSQINLINNYLFLYIQCLLIDFFLKIFLSTNDWLNSCISMDRAINVYKGVKFNKIKSKQIAKWIILYIFILTIITYIHDPIYRNIVNDNEEKRIWCITEYSSFIKIYNWIINIIHILLPFIINFISACFIIKNIAEYRVKTQRKQNYRQILIEQFQEHKHLIISSIILFLLTIPRLILSFLSGCMKSPRNPWLYLIGYFISFIPSILTSIVFILPSKLYRQQLKQSINYLCYRSK